MMREIKNSNRLFLVNDRIMVQNLLNMIIPINKFAIGLRLGPEDRRGRRIASLPSRTPEEELRDKIVELEKRNLDLQMENDLLKKVRELEGGVAILIHQLAI